MKESQNESLGFPANAGQKKQSQNQHNEAGSHSRNVHALLPSSGGGEMRNPKAEKLVNRVNVQIRKARELNNTVLGSVPARELYNMLILWIASANRLLADGQTVDDIELEVMVSVLKRKRDSIQNRKTAIHKHILS